MPFSDAAMAQMQAIEERREQDRAAYRQEEHQQNLETLQVGDWVITSHLKAGRARAGVVVDLHIDDDANLIEVVVFEANPQPDIDHNADPCEACGTLPGFRWHGESFTCPVDALVEIHPADHKHRQWAAKRILKVVADNSNTWTQRDTRRTLTALAIVEGHEA